MLVDTHAAEGFHHVELSGLYSIGYTILHVTSDRGYKELVTVYANKISSLSLLQ